MTKPAHTGKKTVVQGPIEKPGVSESPEPPAPTSPAENPVQETEPKRKPGRPKGIEKVPGSGRKKRKPNRLTGDMRAYILQHGNILERLFKIANGYKVRQQQPDGTAKMTVPPLDSQLKALVALLDRALPSLKTSTIVGKDDGPIKITSDTPEGRTAIARRVAFLLTLGATPEGNAYVAGAATDGDSDRHSASHSDGDEQISQPTPVKIGTPPIRAQNPCPPTPEDNSNSETAPLVNAPPSELPTSGSENFLENSEADAGDVDAAPVAVGYTRQFELSDYSIRCEAGSREGLPPMYALSKFGDGVVVNGSWERVMVRLRRLAGDDLPSYRDEETRPEASGYIQRDQMPTMSAGRPQVLTRRRKF